jgi:Uma2 family endonuclease
MRGSDEVRAGSRVKLTYDDFLLFPDDGKRHELIEGEHYVTPSPSARHQTIVGRLFLVIGNWLEAHPVGRLFLAPFDVVFSHYDIVEPDLLYMSNRRAADILTEKHVAGVPELVVEIVSPGTRKRDETLKRRLYKRTGVTEYWTVDPERNAVRVHRRAVPGATTFNSPIELSSEPGDVLTTPLLPGLDIPLTRIFAVS